MKNVRNQHQRISARILPSVERTQDERAGQPGRNIFQKTSQENTDVVGAVFVDKQDPRTA